MRMKKEARRLPVGSIDLYNTGVQDLPILSMELHTLSWLILWCQLQLICLHYCLLQTHHELSLFT